MKYSYSDNEEYFSGQCDSLAEALSEALDNYGADLDDDDVVYVGEATQKTIGAYFDQHDAESILEQLAESAGEECGEVTEDWLVGPRCPSRQNGESTEDQKAKIDAYRQKKAEWTGGLVDGIRAALEKWATDNDEQPGFWHINNVKSYTRAEAEEIIARADPRQGVLL